MTSGPDEVIHGLDAPGLPLFQKFKDEVEASSKTQTKKTP
jgi:hypothetical protein